MGDLTVGIDMVRRKEIRVRGSSSTKLQYPKEYPNLPKTKQCASERYGQEGGGESLVPAYAESEAAEVNVAPLRLQWSQLKAW